jgi:hypothetical protein
MTLLQSKSGVNYTFAGSKIKPAIQEALRGYIEDRRSVGGFLTAVLENNLTQAFGRADPENLATLYEIVQWVYMEAPAPCWGSPEKVKAWLMSPEAVTFAMFPAEELTR